MRNNMPVERLQAAKCYLERMGTHENSREFVLLKYHNRGAKKLCKIEIHSHVLLD